MSGNVIAVPRDAVPAGVRRRANRRHGMRRGYLVGPRLDGWLVGGFGLVAWLVFTVAARTGGELGAIASGPVYWLLLAISGTHFGISYHLAYGEGRVAVRRRWPWLIAAPAVLAVVCAATLVAALIGGGRFTDETVRLLLVTVYTMTTWHYVKQVFGVAVLGGSLARLRVPAADRAVLRYGLYPLWFLDALEVWTGRPARFGNFDAGYDLLPAEALSVAGVAAAFGAGAIAVSLTRIAVFNRALPATVWTPYALAFLWLLFPPSAAGLVLFLGALHALQYLACAHRAEVAWGRERAPETPRIWWASVFGAAMATGMLLVYWLPRMLTDAAGAAGASYAGGAAAAVLFVYFNLHHYLVDASIWRSGGTHVERIVAGPSPR